MTARQKFEKDLNKNEFAAWNFILEYCAEYKKKIDLKDCAFLKQNGKCGGFCDGNRIVVAINRPKPFPTLAHEFCHLQQAVENSPLWEDFSWPKKFNIKAFDQIYKLLLLERDCDLRVLELNKKFNFTNPNLYARQANLYLFFYHFVFLRQKWQISTTIYHPELMKLMPDSIVGPERLSIIDMPLMAKFDEILG